MIFKSSIQKKKVWSEVQLKEKPLPRSQHSSIALGDNYLLILGGYTGDDLLDDVWCFDIKEEKWKQLLVISEKKGPKGLTGLSKNEFRVRPSTHTSILLRWNSGVASILVIGFCGSKQTYLLQVCPKQGTMEWTPLKATLSPCTGHSYVSAPINGPEGALTVVTFGGIINDDKSEERNYSYLRSFDVI